MRINLLPPELRERQRARNRTVAIILVGILLLVGLGGLFVLQQMRIQDLEDDLAAQRERNAGLEAEIVELQRFGQLQEELEIRQALLASLLADEVLWSGILRDVSLVIPGETWLSTLSGQVEPLEPGTTEGDGETSPAELRGLIGQINFSGFGFDHRAVALWLTRLEDVTGFANPWLSNSQKTTIGAQEAVEFQSSVDLSEDALARQGGQP